MSARYPLAVLHGGDMPPRCSRFMNPRVMTNRAVRGGGRCRKKERGRDQGSQQETENDTLHQSTLVRRIQTF
jgi:hypothetical protein